MSSSSVEPVEVFQGAKALHLVAFPAAWLSLELDELDGDERTAERPETGRQVLDRLPRAVALLDGPMFELPGGGTNYATATAGRLLYRLLDRRRGINRSSRYPDRGATLSVMADGRASMLPGARELEGASVAVQGYPSLLLDGAVQRTSDRDTTGRAALCLLADGRVGFAVARCSMPEFAEVLRASPAGVRGAVYTDGGGSTTLALRGEGGRLLVAHGLDSRRLPVYLLAEPAPMGPGMVGNPSGPPGAPGGFLGPVVKVLGAAALATAAGATAAAWWRRRRASRVELVEHVER